jgi:transposase
MRAFSADLRLRIHEACLEGESTTEVAQRFAVSPAFVRRLLQRFRETASLAPKSGKRGPTPKLAAREDELRAAIETTPDATAAEHNRRLNLGVSDSTVWRTIRRLGLTFKKSRSQPANNSVPM